MDEDALWKMKESVPAEEGALQRKVHCGKGRIVEKAALWKSEKYAKKIWHACLD